MMMRVPDHPPQIDPNGIEPHHVPHGYVYPKERHHWWWYAGFAAGFIAIALVVMAFRQFDQAGPPLCSRAAAQVLTSPNGAMELSLAQVSCFGGAQQQRLMIRRLDAGSGAPHSLVVFDDAAKVRATWISDGEIVFNQRGGRIETYQPIWRDVRIHYKK